jgi:coenzyme PQQ precursor peptide PqqA
MVWTTPVLIEICIGLEINGYMPADGYVPRDFWFSRRHYLV